MIGRRESNPLSTQIFFEERPVRHVEGHIEQHLGLACSLRANTKILVDKRTYLAVEILGFDYVVYKAHLKGAAPVDILAR